MKKIFYNHQGFTVLELVTVMFIIAILVTVFMANFRGFEHRSVLDSEVQQLASVIRQAQIWALTGQTVEGVRYNYGVHISECASGSCTYYLFKDDEAIGDKKYEAGEELTDGGAYTMLKGAYINSLTPAISQQLDIVFVPPYATVYFNGLQEVTTAQIVFKHTVFSDQKIITIDLESGQISTP